MKLICENYVATRNTSYDSNFHPYPIDALFSEILMVCDLDFDLILEPALKSTPEFESIMNSSINLYFDSNFEAVIFPDGTMPEKKAIVLHDPDFDIEDKLYMILANCDDIEQIKDFCSHYGALINPYLYRSSDSNRDFPVLKDIIETALSEFYESDISPLIQKCAVAVNHFLIYQKEIKMLVSIHFFLSNEITEISFRNFILECQEFLKDDSFYDLICIEYSNVLDDDIEKMFSQTPICHLRYLIGKDEPPETDALEEFLHDTGLIDSTIDCLLRMITSDGSSDFNLLEKEIIKNTAKQISTDLLSFHLHDIASLPMIADKNNSLDCFITFPSLISMIFYDFYIDVIIGGMVLRKCANPNCERIFACKKNSRQKNCSDRCARNAAQKRYKERGKNKNSNQAEHNQDNHSTMKSEISLRF